MFSSSKFKQKTNFQASDLDLKLKLKAWNILSDVRVVAPDGSLICFLMLCLKSVCAKWWFMQRAPGLMQYLNKSLESISPTENKQNLLFFFWKRQFVSSSLCSFGIKWAAQEFYVSWLFREKAQNLKASWWSFWCVVFSNSLCSLSDSESGSHSCYYQKWVVLKSWFDCL